MSDSLRLKSLKDGPIKNTFGESIRMLAKSYYPFIYSDNRNISKPVVDLQAAFEVCTESLDEFDKISTEMSSFNYAIFGLEQALNRAVTELSIIREEVVDLMAALRTSEKFNLRLLDQLSILEENIKSGIDASRNAMSSGRNPNAIVGLSPDNYIIPATTKETLEAIIDSGKPTAFNMSGGTNHLLNENISPDMARAQWFNQIQRDLAQRHAEFSFLLISLWSEQVRDNFFLSTRKARFQGSGGSKADGKNRGLPFADDTNLLRMASAAKIDDLSSVIQTIQGRVFELGGMVFDEMNRMRSQLDDTKLQHRTLNLELHERRKQLVDSLLATHSAVQTLLDLDERNDALVGKLVKSRPLFADLYRLVQTEAAADSRAMGQDVQSLAATLGPQNWKNLIDQLGSLPLNQNDNSLSMK